MGTTFPHFGKKSPPPLYVLFLSFVV